MRPLIPTILLWLFVINLGIALGAGLYEGRIVFPQWLVQLPDGSYQWNAEAARQANTGLRFWVFVTTVPLTLLTLANLIAGWFARHPERPWWLAAAGLILVERILTFSYFIPTMVTLQNETGYTESELVSMAQQWGQLNNLRHLLSLLGWLAALKAFSLFNKQPVGR